LPALPTTTDKQRLIIKSLCPPDFTLSNYTASVIRRDQLSALFLQLRYRLCWLFLNLPLDYDIEQTHEPDQRQTNKNRLSAWALILRSVEVTATIDGESLQPSVAL
jgi:hypothetical protein